MNESPEWLDDVGLQEEAAKEVPAPSLGYLSELCKELGGLYEEVGQLQIQVSDKNDRISKIERDLIPSLMEELGIASFDLTDGSKVKVKNVIHANITEANRAAAFAWLREHDFDGIIKTKVTAEFGKGEAKLAEEAAAALSAAGFHPDTNESVHAMTLKSFVRERLEAGDAIPLDTFGIHEFKEAEVKAPPKPRTRK